MKTTWFGRPLAALSFLNVLVWVPGAAAQQPLPPLPPTGAPPPGAPPPGAPVPAPPPERVPAPGYPPPTGEMPPPPPSSPPVAPAPEMPATPPGATTWPPPDESQVPDEPDKKKKKKKKGPQGDDEIWNGIVRPQYRGGDLQIGGWILARGDLRRVTVVNPTAADPQFERNTLDISVPSVRFRVDYQSIWPWLSGQLEMDLAGRPDLRDAYVQAKSDNFAVRVGQFKMPVLAFQMESPWTLPVVRRGLIHDLTVDWLDVAGRRPGITFTWRENFDGIKPRLTVGAFQGSFLAEFLQDLRDTDLIRERSLNAQHLVARGQVDVGSAEIGASYQHRVGAIGIPFINRHLWTAGADFTLNHVFATGGLRIWADGLAGASWYEHAAKPPDNEDATFVTGRLLVAYRFGGTTAEAPYIEPYVFGGVIDPDIEVSSDLGWEATAGVNTGYFGRFRVTLQAEIDRVQRNFPLGGHFNSQGHPISFLYGGHPNQMGLLAQVGLAF